MAVDLTSSEITPKEIFKITLSDTAGTILYLTPYDRDIVYAGDTYTSVLIKRTTISFNTELRVDTCDVTLGMETLTIGGTNLNDAIKYGWFDNAVIVISYVDSITPTETYEIFNGFLKGGVRYDQNEIQFTATSILDLLNQNFPKLLYQEPCNHKLYSTYCGIDRDSATWKKTGLVGTYTSPDTIISSAFDYSATSANFFKFGEIQMTSGLSNGISKAIREHGDGFIRVYQPWNLGMTAGDTFTAWAGCDKSGQTCDEKFSNYANFFGFEYIPLPEVLYS